MEIMNTRTDAITVTEKAKKSDKVKSTCIGPRGREVYNTFVFDDGSMKIIFYLVIFFYVIFYFITS